MQGVTFKCIMLSVVRLNVVAPFLVHAVPSSQRSILLRHHNSGFSPDPFVILENSGIKDIKTFLHSHLCFDKISWRACPWQPLSINSIKFRLA